MSQVSNAQNLYSDPAEKSRPQKQKRYSSLARELNQHEGWVVGVLHDPVFEGMETPASLKYEDFAATWGQIPGVKVVALDANQVHSYEILFKGKIDILVFPYGSVFPMDAMGLYSAQTLNYFLDRGGAVLTTGGIPFMKQAGPNGEILPTDTPEAMTAVFDKWVSKLGLKYYECPIPPSRQYVNTALLPSLPKVASFAPARFGVVANNSSHDPVPKPPHGNVFPERYPARQVIPLVNGSDAYGTMVSTSAVLVQDFMNGSRQIFFAYEEEPHPLSPDSPYFKGLMQDLFTLLSNRITAADVEAQYACYRQGETVSIRAEIISHEPGEQHCVVRLAVSSADQPVFSEQKSIQIQPGKNIVEWTWAPSNFERDEYQITVDVIRDQRTLSTVENGFVVWDDEVISHSPIIGLRDKYFTLDGKGTFITGTNYYESTRGEVMWFRPNVANLIRDHQQMHECGVNMIRPHYHHLKWFKDYLIYHHGHLFPFFQELENVTDPMPDERVWRIWDLFIYLSQKYGILYNGDLFTLVPEEMGDPRGWFGTVEAVYDVEKRPCQKEFLRMIEQRYIGVPGITWDLFNEPSNPSNEEVAEWAADLKTIFDELHSNRLITVGGPVHIGATVDYDCPHGRISEDFYNQQNLPILLQELHLDRPEPLAFERLQAEDLRYILVLALRNGIAGICPWSWTRQMRLWQDTYEHHYTFPMEKWDDRLGLHTHDDSTIKPAGQVFKDLAIWLRNIDLQSYHLEEKSISTSCGQLLATVDRKEGHRIVHFEGEQCFGAMAFEKIDWHGKILVEGPAGSYVYFYTPDLDFATSHEIFVKTEGAGELEIAREDVRSISLIDGYPKEFRVLANAEPAYKNGHILINVDPEMTRYWFRIQR